MKNFQWLFLVLLLLFNNSNAFAQGNTATEDIKNITKAKKYLKIANGTKKIKDIASAIDSAEYYYIRSPKDSVLLMIYEVKYRYNYKLKDYSSAISVCDMGVALSKELQNKVAEGNFIKHKGLLYSNQKIYDSSLVAFTRAFDIYLDLINNNKDSINFSYQRGAGYCSYKKGGILYYLNNYDLAIKEFYKGLRFFEIIDYKVGIIQIKNKLGNIYYLNGDLDNAYEEYSQNLVLWKEVYPKKKPSALLLNIGSIFLNRAEYDSALVYYRKSYYARVATKKYEDLKVAGILMNIGIIFKRQELYDSSFIYFNKAYKIYKKKEYFPGIVRTKANIGLGYIEMAQFSKAEKELLAILPMSIELQQAATTQEIYMGLYVINDHRKNFKTALNYYKSYTHYRDSIHSLEITNKINEYKEQFETEKKDRDIENLKQLATLQKLEKQKQIEINKKQYYISVLFGILALTLALTLVVIRRFYKIKRLADIQKHEKLEEDNKQKVIDLVKKQEVNSINSYMEGQEKERGRIASELHDRLGSLLSTVKLHFSSFEADMEVSNESKESFSFALDLLDNSVQEVRTISHNLSKGVLTQFGLSGAIENLKEAINAAGKIQVRYINIGVADGVGPELEIELFRIIQELITNAIKHSMSDEIFIQQINDEDSLTISVEDQGIGFDISKIKGKGIGLNNLKIRAENIGATYTYESAVGQGTSINIELKKQ